MGSRSNGRDNPIVRAKYVEWCKVPRDKRKEMDKAYAARGDSFPTTKDEFANTNNVNRATLWRWEQDPDFKREVANEALGLITADELATMIDAQKQAAMNGDKKAFELLMKFANIAGVTTSQPTDDEDYERYLSKLSDKEIEELYGTDFDD